MYVNKIISSGTIIVNMNKVSVQKDMIGYLQYYMYCSIRSLPIRNIDKVYTALKGQNI